MKNINSKMYACFVLLCISIFLYEAFQCTYSFINQTPFSQNNIENQELYPLPSFCFTQREIPNTHLHNLTEEGYKTKGLWRSSSQVFDDEETYKNLSASFEDLVEKIKIKREFTDGSDAYEKESLTSTDNGLLLNRCDSDSDLKCFCLNFSPKQMSFGIQRVTLHMKMDSIIYIVPPLNFYSLQRKHTKIRYQLGFENYFDLLHSISRVLPQQPHPCSVDMDWGQDTCRLKYVNDRIIQALNCTTPWLLAFAR